MKKLNTIQIVNVYRLLNNGTLAKIEKGRDRYSVIKALRVMKRIVEWTVYLYGAGSQVTGTIRLIDLQGNIVSGQSSTVEFSTGTPVTAGDGTQGYAVHSSARNTLLLPTNNPEAYLVEFIAPNISVRSGIGHDINPDT